MRTVAFYSFKGGVGRSTALLNVAYCLAQRGRKVVVADWDLHAPGLSLMEFMRGEPRQPPILGILDWLIGLKEMPGDAARTTVADLVIRPLLSAEAQARDWGGEADLERPPMRGELLFLPAGDLSEGAERFARLVKDAGLHDLHQFFKAIDPKDTRFVFKVFCEELLQCRLPWNLPASRGEPDYLLVDCRTGLTEIGDLLLGEATDFNVLVYAHDPQNLKGLEIALNAHPRHPWQLHSNTLLLWSMEPVGPEALKLEVRRRKRELIDAVCHPDPAGVRETFPEEFEVPYHPELALTNEPIVHRYSDCSLARVFRQVSDRLEVRTAWKDALIGQLCREAASAADGAVTCDLVEPATSSTDGPQAQRLYQEALARMLLGREFSALLYSPPPFDFAGCRLADLCPSWPAEFDEQRRGEFANLLAWSTDRDAASKRKLLQPPKEEPPPEFGRERRQGMTIEEWQALRNTLAEQRRKLVTTPAVFVWNAAVEMLTVACDWWLFAAPAGERREAAARVRSLQSGGPIDGLPVSQSRWFPLLAASVIGRALSPGHRNHLDRTSFPELRNWLLLESGIDLGSAMLELTKAAVERSDSELQELMGPFAWASMGKLLLSESERDKSAPEHLDWLVKAIEAFQHALERGQENPAVLRDLAVAFTERSRLEASLADKVKWLDRAADAFDRSLKHRPDDPETLYRLGVVQHERGLKSTSPTEQIAAYDRAIGALRQSLECRRDAPDVRQRLGAVLTVRARLMDSPAEEAQWLEQSVEEFKESLRLRPHDVDAVKGIKDSLDWLWAANGDRAKRDDIREESLRYQRLLAALLAAQNVPAS